MGSAGSICGTRVSVSVEGASFWRGSKEPGSIYSAAVSSCLFVGETEVAS